MNENQVKFHMLPYIATIITSPYMTEKITKVMTAECSPILKLNANKNV